MPGLLDRNHAPSPEDEIVTRERDLILRDSLESLGGPDREIVVLAARGYRSDEIAWLIGCSPAATRTRLCRARGRLRARLELAG
jgi:DNA-directed RNA polymerase specialized sigma24 family protein